MTYDLEKRLPYPVLALVVLALFYAVYFGKMLAQRRQGIVTDQIGRRREKTLHRVELLMKTATCAIVPAQLLSIALNWSALPDNARLTGFGVGLVGDGVFLAAVLCMRDSRRAGIPDRDKKSKDDIVIEMRDPSQVLSYRGIPNTVPQVKAIYPSFDVVPPHLISGVVTDKGVYVPYVLDQYFDTEAKVFY